MSEVALPPPVAVPSSVSPRMSVSQPKAALDTDFSPTTERAQTTRAPRDRAGLSSNESTPLRRNLTQVLPETPSPNRKGSTKELFPVETPTPTTPRGPPEAFLRMLEADPNLMSNIPIDYQRALAKASVVQTVNFTCRRFPPAYTSQPREDVARPMFLQPLPPRASTAPAAPSPRVSRGLHGNREELKRFVQQRQMEGRAANTAPGGKELEVSKDMREDQPRIAQAADAFNLRHRLRTRTTRALLTGMQHDPTSPRLYEQYHVNIEDIRRNRFFLAEKKEGGPNLSPEEEEELRKQRALRAKLKRKNKWSIDNSIWLPRKEKGNSKDYYETSQAINKMFQADWRLAIKARRGFIEKLIVQYDDSGGGNDVDGDGVEDEVQDVEEILGKHARMLYSAFEYFATADVIAGNSRTVEGEHDVHDLSFTAFLSFCNKCDLVGEHLPVHIVELIFAQVDAKDESTQTEDAFNRTKCLDRQEFLQCIVRIALDKYVKPGIVGDVSDAIEKLCSENIEPKLPEAARQDSNKFRERYCYLREVEMVLRKHMKTLRSLYGMYADLSEGQGDRSAEILDSSSMMSIREWMSLMNHLGLFDQGMMSFYEAKQIFMWARIRSINDNSRHSLIKLRNLYFEDFMEAMVRLAMLLPLPTTDDIEELGVKDAGIYMISLRRESPVTYKQFILDKRGNWYGPPKEHIWCCVDHLLTYLTRLVELNSSGEKDLSLSHSEVQQFAKARKKGIELRLEDVVKADPSVDGKKVTHAQALRKLRERLLASLSKIKQFSHWKEEGLSKLLNCMSVAPFDAGDFIVTQGDVGDEFFMILSGEAEVLRTHESGKIELLKTIKDGETFGKRSLMEDQPRFATVKATTKMRCMRISRVAFEQSFGNLKNSFRGLTAEAQAAAEAAVEEAATEAPPTPDPPVAKRLSFGETAAAAAAEAAAAAPDAEPAPAPDGDAVAVE